MQGTSRLSLRGFAVAVAIDSQDTLYQVKLETAKGDRAFEQGVEEALKGQKAADALLASLEDFPSILSSSTPNQMLLEQVLFAVKRLIKERQGSNPPKIKTDDVDPSRLVCRCFYLDESALTNAFRSAEGDFNAALRETNAGMLCSSCSKDVENLYDSLTFEDLEKRNEALSQKIQSALDEFGLFCPVEFEGMKYEVVSLKRGLVKVKVVGKKPGLAREKIKGALKSYLSAELPQEFDISVFY